MSEAPGGLLLADPDVQFIDATGDGKPDLLVSREGLAGYFPLNHNGQWDRQAFRPFKQRPSFSLTDPEVKRRQWRWYHRLVTQRQVVDALPAMLLIRI
jgi:hypothetical protein